MKFLFEPKWLQISAVRRKTRKEIIEDLKRVVADMQWDTRRIHGEPEPPIMLAEMDPLAIWPPHIPVVRGVPDNWVTVNCVVAGTTEPPAMFRIEDFRFVDCPLPLFDVPDEADPKKKNKIARKKRDGNKASQNARGRKWWEHR